LKILDELKSINLILSTSVYKKEDETEEDDLEEKKALRPRRNLQTPDTWGEPLTGQNLN